MTNNNTKVADADSAADDAELPGTVSDETAEPAEKPADPTKTDAEEPAEDDEPAAVAAKPTRGLRLIAAGGALVVVASIASAVYFYLQFDKEREAADAKSAASAAACDHARDLANYDFNNLDPYFSGVLAGATGDWKSQFEGQREQLRNLYSSGQVVSQVTEAQCATLSGSQDTADVLVVVTESITNVMTEGQPQLAQVAMRLTLDKVDGDWLVSALSAPQTP